MSRPQLETSRSHTPEGPAPEASLFSLQLEENVDGVLPPAPTPPKAVPNAVTRPDFRASRNKYYVDHVPPSPRARGLPSPWPEGHPLARKPLRAIPGLAPRAPLRDLQPAEKEGVPLRAHTPPRAVPNAAPRAPPSQPPVTNDTLVEIPGPNLHRFLVDPTFTDISLHYGPHSTPAHKIILCSQSQWFAHALEPNSSLTTLRLEGYWSWSIRALLSFLYARSYTPIYHALIAHTAAHAPVMAPPEWHARVYHTALHFAVPGLITHAVANFRAACAHIMARARRARVRGEEEVGVDGVVKGVGFVYTLPSSQPTTHDELRKACVEVVMEGFSRLAKEREFGELVAGNEALGRDLKAAFREEGVDMAVVRGKGSGGLRMG
ncbi:hypothetical protein BU16DRAFT_620204 [Lophium mytilinum]|uniref:BTB domain-containing protein n=1 Tax=Lophium mytilinum TaxID=390894 RepID=A0A6A6QMC8_9PEZI|nr:hypothetical protein BU16DRAFT_620204 [Lophium mytilinum]